MLCDSSLEKKVTVLIVHQRIAFIAFPSGRHHERFRWHGWMETCNQPHKRAHGWNCSNPEFFHPTTSDSYRNLPFSRCLCHHISRRLESNTDTRLAHERLDMCPSIAFTTMRYESEERHVCTFQLSVVRRNARREHRWVQMCVASMCEASRCIAFHNGSVTIINLFSPHHIRDSHRGHSKFVD